MVHCHDGGGRSGTFLAIEANLSMVETRGLVDIFGTVKWLQEQRALLVSHSGFYRLIYDILEDYIKCGDTSAKMEDFLNLDGELVKKMYKGNRSDQRENRLRDSLGKFIILHKARYILYGSVYSCLIRWSKGSVPSSLARGQWFEP